MIEEKFQMLDGENTDEYTIRICSMREDENLTWQEVADIINEETDRSYSEKKYRTDYKRFCEGMNKGYEIAKEENDNSSLSQEEITVKLREFEKAKIKMRDERIDYMRIIREEARKESFVDLVRRVIQEEVKPYDSGVYILPEETYDDDMIVCLSDLHTGMVCDNYWNKFNTDILKQRLDRYLIEILKIQKLHKCKNCYIALGGDNISGLIHVNMRLQNNEDVVRQVKIASLLIGDFIKALDDSNLFERIQVNSVSGNHSRISPNKQDHLKGEELDDLIPFYLNVMFMNRPNVKVYEDCSIDSTIDSIVTRAGRLFYIIHGDKDSEKGVASRLTMMLGRKPDGVIMGHRHHNAYNTIDNVKIIQNGSFEGVDDHCINMRISGSPEQVVFLTNADRVVKCLYDINLG